MYQFVKAIVVWVRTLVTSSAKRQAYVPEKWDVVAFVFEVDWYMEAPKEVTEVHYKCYTKPIRSLIYEHKDGGRDLADHVSRRTGAHRLASGESCATCRGGTD